MAFSVSNDAFTIADAEYNLTTLAVNDVSGSNYNRTRFSGAHELAHIFLEHDKRAFAGKKKQTILLDTYLPRIH